MFLLLATSLLLIVFPLISVQLQRTTPSFLSRNPIHNRSISNIDGESSEQSSSPSPNKPLQPTRKPWDPPFPSTLQRTEKIRASYLSLPPLDLNSLPTFSIPEERQDSALPVTPGTQAVLNTYQKLPPPPPPSASYPPSPLDRGGGLGLPKGLRREGQEEENIKVDRKRDVEIPRRLETPNTAPQSRTRSPDAESESQPLLPPLHTTSFWPSILHTSASVLGILVCIFAFAVLIAHCLAWFIVYKTEARLGEVRQGVMRGGEMRVCLCAK